MTRFEEHEPIDREQLKREIRQEIKHDEKRHRLVAGLIVAAFFLVLLATPFFVAGVLVAKSGLYEVPLLSGWFFRPVEPSEKVRPVYGVDVGIVMTNVVSRAKFNESISGITLDISQQELTNIVNASISKEDSSLLPFPVESAQAVLSKDRVELYALTKRDDGAKVPVLVSLELAAQDGQLVADSHRLVIGSLDVPDFIADAFVNSAIDNISEAIATAIGGEGSIEDITVTPKKVELLIIANQ